MTGNQVETKLRVFLNCLAEIFSYLFIWLAYVLIITTPIWLQLLKK